jgi:hypothetical protein
MYFFSPSSAHVNVFFFVVSFGLANEYEPMSHVPRLAIMSTSQRNFASFVVSFVLANAYEIRKFALFDGF